MASVNKVILIGTLGRDPEVRYAPSGDAICSMSIATESSWKDKASGEKKSETEWHRIVLFGKLGEIAGKCLKKGKPVYIEGELKTRKWTDKDGVDRYTTEIRANVMQMLGARDSQDAPADSSDHQRAKQDGYAPAPKASGGFDDFVDDLPFN